MLAAFLLTTALAQDAPLRVGVAELPPFAFQSSGQWDGIAVSLWREVADDLGLEFDFVAVPLDEVVDRVAGGDVDLALTGVADAEDEARVDFTYPYYTATLGVATPRTQSLWKIVRGLFTARFFRIFLFLSAFLLVVGVLIWLLERGANDNHFGGERSSVQGIGAGFWWAAVTMTTIGYGDKAPVTFWGRALAFLWMIVAMGVTASLTAALVSVVAAGQSDLKVPGDLRDMRVGGLAGTSTAAYLREEGIEFRAFDTPLEGLRTLRAGDLDAFAASEATLRYLKNENSGLTFRITRTNAAPQRYAFVLPEASERQEALDRALLARLNARPFERLLERYLPEA